MFVAAAMEARDLKRGAEFIESSRSVGISVRQSMSIMSSHSPRSKYTRDLHCSRGVKSLNSEDPMEMRSRCGMVLMMFRTDCEARGQSTCPIRRVGCVMA